MGILLGVSVMGIPQCQGILLGVFGFRVSALNRVCPSVRPSNILLTRRLSEMGAYVKAGC